MFRTIEEFNSASNFMQSHSAAEQQSILSHFKTDLSLDKGLTGV